MKMVYDDQDWAIFGSISSESTHIMLRVALRAEIPIVNSASTDPTIPETYIPWYFTDLQDDRVQSFTLARRIFTELGLKRVANSAREQSLWPVGRAQVPRCLAAAGPSGGDRAEVHARRHGLHAAVAGDPRFARRRHRAVGRRDARRPTILKQMRALGMKQRVFGSYRTLGPTLLAEAGDAAEGFEAVFPYDPTRNDPKWLDFNTRFEARFHEKPEQFASLAYDAMNALLDSICKAGLNRARIHDALADIEEYDGVTGHMVFDPNQKNVAPMYLGTVHNGAITYRVATMEKPPAVGQTPLARQEDSSTNIACLVPASSPCPALCARGRGWRRLCWAASRAICRRGRFAWCSSGRSAKRLRSRRRCRRSLRPPRPRAASGSSMPVASDQNWGAASTQLVHALMDEHALAIVALDRDAAHLAEQLALKAFVPVVALSSDKKLTSTNIPWIFRLPPETTPAAALGLLEAAAARSGANPERLRDVLASGKRSPELHFCRPASRARTTDFAVTSSPNS